uniref:Uncharacterized protein n=1 Tax=Haemonchus contortus TaxID=6289 RepID=A0A7I4YIQ9_HAECO
MQLFIVIKLLLYVISTCTILASNCYARKRRRATGRSPKVKQKRRGFFANLIRPPKQNSLRSSGSQIDMTDRNALEKQEFLPYPSVKSPTASAKKRRQQELLDDKKKKIEEGFYQPHSDEDDTLEQIISLDMEHSETSKMSKKAPKQKRASLILKPGSQKALAELEPGAQ